MSQKGFSLMELLVAVGLMATGSAVAVPRVLAALDDLRTVGAARYVASRLQQTRMEAVSRMADTAVRFSRTGQSYVYAVFVDGDGDGVRSLDIQSGVDREIHRGEELAHRFPGVEFGTLPTVPSVDPSGAPPGSDPIRLGSSDMITFGPLGTSTPGSLYILGPNGRQFVIRVFGETGKSRILRFDTRNGDWVPL
jgi:prepilin-type N-terminal cleavage/methylation domain-containing protein